MEFDLVVCGGGMVGLTAACALAPFFESIAIVDARHRGQYGEFRRSVAQAAHVHHLLHGGQEWLSSIIPGIDERLSKLGAQKLDYSGNIAVYVGREVMPLREFGLTVSSLSRAAFDSVLLEFANQIPRLTFFDGHMVEGSSSKGNLIQYLHLRKGTMKRTVGSRFVLDCTGASSREHWLKQAQNPAKFYRCSVDLHYASSRCLVPDLSRVHPSARGLIINPSAEDSRFMAVIPVENSEAIFTCGLAGSTSGPIIPNSKEFIKDLFRDRGVPAEILFQDRLHRFGQRSIYWRRFSMTDELPLNYFPLGDFVCQLTPLSGQGMTLAFSHVLTLSRSFAGNQDYFQRQSSYFEGIERFSRFCWISALSRQPLSCRSEPGNEEFSSEIDAFISIEQNAISDAEVHREVLSDRHYLGAPPKIDFSQVEL
jgi:2-polyprenyl-6-methoxyphenol hydroxylase-like FAD-dependent oxidoreductase